MDELPFVPRWNYYRCEECRGFFVTVDVDQGVTPEFTKCKVQTDTRPNGCGGRMKSAHYPQTTDWRVIIPKVANAEWYKPGADELERLSRRFKMLHRHALNDGLLLRPPSDTTPTFPTIPREVPVEHE